MKRRPILAEGETIILDIGSTQREVIAIGRTLIALRARRCLEVAFDIAFQQVAIDGRFGRQPQTGLLGIKVIVEAFALAANRGGLG